MEAVAFCAGMFCCVVLYLAVAVLNTWGEPDEDRQEERYRSLLARWMRAVKTPRPCEGCYDGDAVELERLASETREVLR